MNRYKLYTKLAIILWRVRYLIENNILHHILITLLPTFLNIFFLGPYTLAMLAIYFKDIEYHKKCLCKKLLALDKQIPSIYKYFINSLLPSTHTHTRNIYQRIHVWSWLCLCLFFPVFVDSEPFPIFYKIYKGSCLQHTYRPQYPLARLARDKNLLSCREELLSAVFG